MSLISKCSVTLNKTYTHILPTPTFANLSSDEIIKIFKDGRPFSHFIEKWLEKNYPLIHITGCKDHDFIDKEFRDTKYDEKTFTSKGCKFCPSNMLGAGRSFNAEIFKEKSSKLIYCIVSNVNFPEIKIKFVNGTHLAEKYPKGNIPLSEHIKFFD